jgi:hypothetical protein
MHARLNVIERHAREALAEAFSAAQRVLGPGRRKHQQEFLAAPAGEHIGRARHL